MFKKYISLLFLIFFAFFQAVSADEAEPKKLVVPDNDKIYYHSKYEDNTKKQPQTNIIKVEVKDEGIISQSSIKINSIYPMDNINPQNNFPGYRGPNQLVIYTRGFGKTTGTNEFGKEAVVVDNVVTALTGANSIIPHDGFVISGHGNAKKWITDNLKIGTKVEIDDRTLRSYTTIESYRYQAKMKIKQVQEILISSKVDYGTRNDKLIYQHLKKAKQKYKKSKKDNDNALDCAKEAIEEATLAYRYSLPYVKDEFRGVWIRPNSKNLAQIQDTLDKIKDTGINNVFLETYYHGRTIFPSRVMREYGFNEQNPEFQGVDVLAIWVREAHKRKIKVHCWFESFYIGNKPPQYDPKNILYVKPSWMNRTKSKADFEGFVSHPQEHNGYFLDPANSEVTNFLLNLISEMAGRYDIDGVNIDYVRYPNIMKENYSNQWGYTQFARNEFKNLYGIDPIELNKNDDFWDTWCEYRSDKITSYIQKASELFKNRNILFSAVIFPDYKISKKTKFQDWALWLDKKYIDAVTPLILTSDDELANSMLSEIKKKSNNAIVYPGLFAGFIESDPEDLLKQIHAIRKLKLNGVILFDWAHLNTNYQEALKANVFKGANVK